MKLRRFAAFLVVLLACAVAVWASNSLSQSTAVSTAAVSTTNVTFGGNVANGDLIIACDNWGNNVGTHAMTDNKSGGSNTYTAFVQNEITLSGLNDLYCAWAIHAGSAAALTVTSTITGGGSHTLRLAIYDFASTTGWNASPVDQSAPGNHTTSGTTSGDAGNVTPTVTNTLLFSAIQFVGAVSAITVGGGCTEATAGGSSGNGWTSSDRADGAYNLSAGLSATKCTFTWTTSFGYSAVGQNFKPVAGGAVSVRHKVVQN